MKDIYIPMRKYCGRSCHKVCKIIDFGNDLDLYIRKVKVISLKSGPKTQFLLLICFLYRRNVHQPV